MANYLDIIGLQKYDELIKDYIGKNGGKIDEILVKTTPNTTGNSAIEDGTKTATIDLTPYIKQINIGTSQFTPVAGVLGIAVNNLKDIISAATDSASGLMTAQDKTNLDTLVKLLGNENGDEDNNVNTIREVLTVFENHGEGVKIASALADKANKNDVYDKSSVDTLLNSYVKTGDFNTTLNDYATIASLSGYVPTTRTINGRDLSKNITGLYGVAQGGKTYYPGDIVASGGLVYVCLKNTTITTSSPITNTTNWLKIGASQNATTGGDGLMANTDKEKLNGIEASATADSAIPNASIEALFAAA